MESVLNGSALRSVVLVLMMLLCFNQICGEGAASKHFPPFSPCLLRIQIYCVQGGDNAFIQDSSQATMGIPKRNLQ